MSDAPHVLLVNTNRIEPPIAPVALDYLGAALADAGYEARLLDLCFAEDIGAVLDDALAERPALVALSFRNTDDCHWSSGRSFMPVLAETMAAVRRHTDAPVVVGGCGFSLFPEQIISAVGADYGVMGDGEKALVALVEAVEGRREPAEVPGLVWRAGGDGLLTNPPDRTTPLRIGTARAFVNNERYFRQGGQLGVETKRGCSEPCAFCADPAAKGRRMRLRPPEDVAEEMAGLADRGLDVFHLCDCEFNIPPDHALAVCRAISERGLGERIRWYTYASIVPFSSELAQAMRRAGCAGVNFGTDSANEQMLAQYRRRHRKPDIASAVALCKKHGMRVMLDLLLGGPGETEETVRDTIEFMKELDPDCVGASVGVRLYPGTAFTREVLARGPLSENPNIDILGEGEAGDLLRPVFYVSRELGDKPASVVCDLIAGDPRFFEPVDRQSLENYNYNDNRPLAEAIRQGARGAYWDILHRMRMAL